MFEITWRFFWYRAERAGPSNKGPKRIYRLFNISFKPSIFCFKLKMQNCFIFRSQFPHVITFVVRFVIKNFREPNGKSNIFKILKKKSILKYSNEQTLLRKIVSKL